jgi:hypothetical protein
MLQLYAWYRRSGCKCSIFRWKWIIIRLNETSTERENRLAEAREERFTRLFQNVQGRAGEHDLHWVDVDPGRKNVVTAFKLDDDNEHWSFKLSSIEYHHGIKANERKEKKRHTASEGWCFRVASRITHYENTFCCCYTQLYTKDFCLKSSPSNLQHQVHKKNEAYEMEVYMHRLKIID